MHRACYVKVSGATVEYVEYKEERAFHCLNARADIPSGVQKYMAERLKQGYANWHCHLEQIVWS